MTVKDQHHHDSNNVHEIFIVNDLVCSHHENIFLVYEDFYFVGDARKNQDLGEDEYRASNDDDAQRSNNSDDNNNNNQENDYVNNFRGMSNFELIMF